MTTTEVQELTWVSGGVACRTLGTHHARLLAIVEQGRVRTKQLPGGRRFYALEDCRALAAQSVAGEGVTA